MLYFECRNYLTGSSRQRTLKLTYENYTIQVKITFLPYAKNVCMCIDCEQEIHLLHSFAISNNLKK